MRWLLTQRSRIRRWRYVGGRGVKRWRTRVESTWSGGAQSIKGAASNFPCDADNTIILITAPTWRRRVGVGIARRRPRRVHSVGGWRRVGVGPISHVGTPTKACSHRLTSGC